METSTHVLACLQAPVHPCTLTCSLVWNQLQKAAVILCYSASSILKAAIKVWHWLKAIQLTVTVKQKLRVNWSLFCCCCFFPSCSLVSSWNLKAKIQPYLWKVLAGKNERRMLPMEESPHWCLPKKGWKGNAHLGARRIFSQSWQPSCCLLKIHSAWAVAPYWMTWDVLWLNPVVIIKCPLAFLLPSALCPPHWLFQAFIRPVGSFPVPAEERGKVRGGGGWEGMKWVPGCSARHSCFSSSCFAASLRSSLLACK